MPDYRLVKSVLVQEYSYRQVEVMASCSHRSIAKACKAMEQRGLSKLEQVENLAAVDLAELFADGRRAVSELSVDFDVDAVVAARIGRKAAAEGAVGPIPGHAGSGRGAALRDRAVLPDRGRTRAHP